MSDQRQHGGDDADPETTWSALERAAARPAAAFDPSTVADLPDPARRLLLASLPVGAPLAPGIELEMAGEIRLAGRWLPFTARQILVAGVGFVWRPVVGGRILRFVGADVLGPAARPGDREHHASMNFRLHGLVPVVRASGPDVARSAAGRLAAETVAWLPQQLTPQAGARWRANGTDRAVVAVPVPDGTLDVDVTVDDDGRLCELGLERWNGSATPPRPQPFGGHVDTVRRFEDVAIAERGVVGWNWREPDQPEGEFFRFSITAARFLGAHPADGRPAG